MRSGGALLNDGRIGAKDERTDAAGNPQDAGGRSNVLHMGAVGSDIAARSDRRRRNVLADHDVGAGGDVSGDKAAHDIDRSPGGDAPFPQVMGDGDGSGGVHISPGDAVAEFDGVCGDVAGGDEIELGAGVEYR